MHTAIALLFLAACATTQRPSSNTVDQIVGTWVGKGDTPFGEMPIALDFKRVGGDVHARMGDAETYLDFRFHRDGETWLLTEEGQFPGLGVLRHTLAPRGDATWADKDLVVAFELTASTLVMTTTLRGEPHATFRLSRAAGAKVTSRR